MPLPTLETQRLRLRPLRVDDAAAMHLCYGDPEAMRFWDFPASRTLEETRRRIAHAAKPAPLRRAAWAVVPKEGEGFFGMLNYHHREPRNRRLEAGWILARAQWGKGIMGEAMGAFLDHCFGALRVHRVEATIDPENAASIRLAERLGFRREAALMREVILVGGRYRSLGLYALLADEWRR